MWHPDEQHIVDQGVMSCLLPDPFWHPERQDKPAQRLALHLAVGQALQQVVLQRGQRDGVLRQLRHQRRRRLLCGDAPLSSDLTNSTTSTYSGNLAPAWLSCNAQSS